ncbi:MAG TPA: 50S ribosomal protein L24 [Rhodospirillaceae bacterium]|nr:50S ribosomal protein L24 [Rhodospirillaceae bacterium]
MAAKVKKGDQVMVIAGKDKGKKGQVKLVMPTEKRVVVEGVGMVTKHTRPSMSSQGGLEKREAPIHLSNVALLDPKSGKPTRVGFKTLDDGRKVRIARPSGEQIDS